MISKDKFIQHLTDPLGRIIVFIITCALLIPITANAQDNEITYGATVQGTIGAESPFILYRFRGTGSTRIEVTVTTRQSRFFPRISLMDANLRQLALSSTRNAGVEQEQRATLAIQLPQSGFYTLMISSVTGLHGEFELSLRSPDALVVPTPTTLATSPVLLQPEAGSVQPFTGSITFAWEPMPNAFRYLIQREACQPGYTGCAPLIPVETDSASLTIEHDDLRPAVRWRVRATFTDGTQSPFSEWSQFTLDTRPVLLQPEAGSVQPFTGSITFAWEPMPNAFRYLIQREACQPGYTGCAPLIPVETDSASLTIEHDDLRPAVRWRVRATFTDGTQSPFSEWSQFTLDTRPVLLQPEAGSVQPFTGSITFAWKPMPNAFRYLIQREACQPGYTGCAPLIPVETDSASLTIEHDDLRPAVRWRVRATFTDGTQSPFSEWSQFTFGSPTATPLAMSRSPQLTVTPSPTPAVFPTVPPQVMITLAPTATQTPTPIPPSPSATPTPTSVPTDDPASSLPPGDLLLELGLAVSSLSFELVWPPDPVNYANIRAYVSDSALLEPGITYELRLECTLQPGNNVMWMVFGASGAFPRTCGEVVPLAFGPNRPYWDMQVMLDDIENPVSRTFRLVAAPVDAVVPMQPPLDLLLSFNAPVFANGALSFPQGMRDTDVTLILPTRETLPDPVLFEVTVTCAGRAEPLRWNILNTIDIHQPTGFDMGPHSCGATVPFAYSQPEVMPYISVWYDWPAAQSSVNFTIWVRPLRTTDTATPTPPTTPTQTPQPEGSTDIPIAPVDRDHILIIRTGEEGRFSDVISYPEGDISDTIAVMIEGLTPERGETVMVFTLECVGVGAESVRWSVRGVSRELTCGATVPVPFAADTSQRNVLIAFELSTRRGHVTYTLWVNTPR